MLDRRSKGHCYVFTSGTGIYHWYETTSTRKWRMGASVCQLFSRQPFWPDSDNNLKQSYQVHITDHSSWNDLLRKIFQIMFILYRQGNALENNAVPIKPSCFTSLSLLLKFALINATEPDHAKRLYAHETADLFHRMGYPILEYKYT